MRKIMIIDDMPANLKILGEILHDRYNIIVSTGGSKAVDIAASQAPELILLDVMMPGMDGYELCRALKAHEGTADIPVIFITALNNPDEVVKGFEAGGVDFIMKPFNPKELNARVDTQMELVKSRYELSLYMESLEELGRQLLSKNQELHDTVERLNISVRTDYLTGLPNRVHMMERLKAEAARNKRGGNQFSLIIADIDLFKNINDEHGHDCGDYALKEIAGIMRGNIREQDMLARWGGEEFLFLLPETDAEGAAVLAEKIRASVEKTQLRYDKAFMSVTVTMGVASYDNVLGIDGSIKKADEALYEGKSNGRNKAVQAK